MKRNLKILTLIFVVLCTVFMAWSFGVPGEVANAADSQLYMYVAPSNLEGNPNPGVSSVAVIDGETGDTLFYLVESYYYPVKSVVISQSLTVYLLDGLGINATVDTSTLGADQMPKAFENVSLENAMPANLLLKEGLTLTVDEKTVDSTWTIKPLGIKDDKYYVSASLNDDTVFGLVEKSNFTVEALPYHQIDQARRDGMLNATPDGEIIGNPEGNKSTLLRVILIIGIAVPAVIIAIMLFKPGRGSAKTNYDRHAMKTRRDEDVDYDRDRRYDRDRDYSRREPRDYDRDYRDRDFDRYSRDRDRERDYSRDYRDRDYDRRGREYDDRRDDYDRNDRRRRDDYDRGYRD